PRGERADGACQPDDPRGPGRGGLDRPAGGRGGDAPFGATVQRGSSSQRVGIPGAAGVLPGRALGTVRGTTSQTVPGPAPSPGAKPGATTRDLGTGRGGGCFLISRPVCATTVETLQGVVRR